MAAKEILFSDVRTLVKSISGVEVYPDDVPEGKNKPAIALNHVSQVDTRLQSGEISGTKEVYRISVVTDDNDIDGRDSIIKKFREVDNTAIGDFQSIHVIFVMRESKENFNPFRRAFIDIRLVKK